MPEIKPLLIVMHHPQMGYIAEYTSTHSCDCIDEFWELILSKRDQDKPIWAHLICKKSGHMAATYSKVMGFKSLH